MVLTIIFAAYVLALLCALLTVGALSDHLGRRPVLLSALVLEIVSMLVFIFVGSEMALIAARLLQGLATGAAMGALGAYLIELEASVRPGLGTVLNGAGPALGLAIGAVASSLVIASTPGSIHVIFVVLLVVLVLQMAGTALGPETVTRIPGAIASLRPRVHFPPATRRSAVWVLPGAVATWSLGGLILSLGPNLIRSMAGPDSIVLTGFIIAALTGTGCVASLLLGAVRSHHVLALGMGTLFVGLAVSIPALLLNSAGLYFTAIIIAGFGFGAGFLGVLRILMPQAAPHERAGLLSAIYVVSYLANSAPAVVAGAVAGKTGLIPTAIGYTGAVMALALFVLLGLFIRSRTAARPNLPIHVPAPIHQ